MKTKNAAKIFWDYLSLRSVKKENESLKDFLKNISFFASLNDRQLLRVAEVLYPRDYSENESLFEYGQPGAALFVIESGQISIEIPAGEDRFTQVAVLGDDVFLGELALLDDSPRSASARAIKPTKCYSLFRADLHKLVDTDPEIATQIYKNLAIIVGERLKQTNELINKENEDHSSNVA